MAAKLILNNAKSPLGYLLRSSALSSERIGAGAKPLAGSEALRRGIFDSEAQKLAGVRLWGMNSGPPLVLRLAAARGGGPKKTMEVEEVKEEEYDSNADSAFSDEGNITDFEGSDKDYDSPSEGSYDDDDDDDA